ncbi:hypothetical protein BH11ACT4_BH11ACT4_02130 [soil metagenome]
MMQRVGLRRSTTLAAAGVVTLLAFSLITGSLPPIIVGAALPWVLAMAPRYGPHAALAIVLLCDLLLFAVSMVITALTGLPISSAIVVFAAAAVVGGVLLQYRARPAAPRRAEWDAVLASLSGSVLWIIFQAASNALPAFERLSWVMRNDSLNNLLFARIFLRNGGILLGATENPAPLPSALVALFVGPGRASVTSSMLVEHDLSRLALGWGCLIVLTCFFAGLMSSAIAARSGAGPHLQVLAGLLGSLAILSWYATGYAMEYGFVNTHVFLTVAFCVLIVAISSRLDASVKVAALAVGCTVMLSVWSPLSLVSIAVLALTLVTRRKELLAASRIRKALVIVTLVQLLAWGLASTIPTLLVQRDALAGAGGIFRSAWWVVFVAGISVVVLDRLLQSKEGRRTNLELVAVVTAVFAGLAILLYVSRRSADPWTYYPVKFAWFVTLLFIVVLIGLVVAALARVRRTAARRVGLAVATGAVAVLIAWTPDVTPNLAMNPLDRLVRSQAVERIQELHKQILANADPDRPTVFWHDLEWGEAEVDLWLISLKADSLDPNSSLRTAAYSSYTDRTIGQLCNIIDLMGPNLTVITSESTLPREVEENCTAPSDLTITVN